MGVCWTMLSNKSSLNMALYRINSEDAEWTLDRSLTSAASGPCSGSTRSSHPWWILCVILLHPVFSKLWKVSTSSVPKKKCATLYQKFSLATMIQVEVPQWLCKQWQGKLLKLLFYIHSEPHGKPSDICWWSLADVWHNGRPYSNGYPFVGVGYFVQ